MPRDDELETEGTDKVSNALMGWDVVFLNSQRAERKQRHDTRELALRDACRRMKDRGGGDGVLRIDGPDGERIERPVIEQHCRISVRN